MRLKKNELQKCCTADRVDNFVKRPSYAAPNRDNPFPNDSYALNKKDTLHPARLIYGIVVRFIQRAGSEFCDAAYTNYQFFQL